MKNKLIRISTVPVTLQRLLYKQLCFMASHYNIVAVSSKGKLLDKVGQIKGVKTASVEMTRKITPFKDVISLWKMYRLLKKEKPLIVHTHTPKAGLIGMLASYLAKVPIRIHTVAGMPLLEAKGIKREILLSIEKLTYFCATRVYPNSFVMKEIIEKGNLCSNSKLKVIGNGSSNGIDTTFFSRDQIEESEIEVLKKFLDIKHTDKVLCFIGRIVTDKGIRELVSAFSCLSKKYSNLKLLLIGPSEKDLDPLDSDTETAISTNPNIYLFGDKADVRPFLAVSDIFVFPSYREGFPNVVMEAGSMRLPCIVSNINGCNEIIKHGINGLIVPVKDSYLLQEAIDYLINDEVLLKQMSAVSREMIVSRYEQAYVWEELLSEYQLLDNQYKKKVYVSKTY